MSSHYHILLTLFTVANSHITSSSYQTPPKSHDHTIISSSYLTHSSSSLLAHHHAIISSSYLTLSLHTLPTLTSSRHHILLLPNPLSSHPPYSHIITQSHPPPSLLKHFSGIRKRKPIIYS